MDVLNIVSWVSLVLGLVCSLTILFDILSGNKQQMMIMNFVYPISALYAGPLALLFYYKTGKKGIASDKMNMNGMQKGMAMDKKPFWQSVAIGALHCGSGCALGDMLAELMLFFLPAVVLGSKLAGTWTIDFVFAFVIGIIFQYYSIKPMKNLSPKDSLIAAVKADTLSLTSWQIGMYGWMAIVFFVIFKHKIPATEPLFWFMMQIAMLCGFATAYPMNWWLVKKGIKELM